MYKEQLEILDLKGDLAVALERGQFEVFYQPIVNMGDERIVSIESLIRWHHPTRGLITPDRFISLAEQTGLIVPIGRWVLREACQQLSRWQRQMPRTAPRTVSVNLSARQLHDPDLVKDVMAAIADSGLNPWQLTLELTESMMIDEFERASRILEQLRASRVQIAIDDFGTGFSSLSYLRRLPVDIIKIDRSFVAEMRNSTTAEALVRMVIDLAKVLDLRTVAEGIEDEAQAEQLSTLLCDEGQGYFFARPQPASQIKALFNPQRKSPLADGSPAARRRRRRGHPDGPPRRRRRVARRARCPGQCSPPLVGDLVVSGDELDTVGGHGARAGVGTAERRSPACSTPDPRRVTRLWPWATARSGRRASRRVICSAPTCSLEPWRTRSPRCLEHGLFLSTTSIKATSLRSC